MKSFDTVTAAQSYISKCVDVPVRERHEDIGDNLSLHISTLDIGNSQFTNIYDVTFTPRHAKPSIHFLPETTCVSDIAATHTQPAALLSGGFFFLADNFSSRPRQSALNLATSAGNVLSLPVVDREAIIVEERQLSGRYLQALGELTIGTRTISWAGSLTTHTADTTVFGNGNAIIKHQPDASTGTVRTLVDSSRFTPVINDDGLIDAGFIRRADGAFVRTSLSQTGSLDIFAHDLVLRSTEEVLASDDVVRVRTIGDLALDRPAISAFTAGPSLHTSDFDSHPINADNSLGSKPPFGRVQLARTLLYQDTDGRTHLRLFDGRPGSATFPGITPDEAVKFTEDKSAIAWGYFLDSGQTAKLCIAHGTKVESFGNSHYLTWPTDHNQPYVWTPARGRPCASIVAVQ